MFRNIPADLCRKFKVLHQFPLDDLRGGQKFRNEGSITGGLYYINGIRAPCYKIYNLHKFCIRRQIPGHHLVRNNMKT